jgi:hypothetical protein
MPTVDLSGEKWGQLMFILANAEFKNGVTWAMVNPLLMEIGEQLRRQQLPAGAPRQQTVEETRAGIRLDSNGQEVRHE